MKAQYRAEQHRPGPNTASSSMYMACLIARKFRTVPSVASLREQFGMSEATAYRWRSAMRAAGWPERAS